MRLQKLTVYAGDYGRRKGGGLRLYAHHEHNRPVGYECWVEGYQIECGDHVDVDYLGWYDMDDIDDADQGSTVLA